MDVIEVEIVNWDRFQEKRKDVTHPRWFRMEHSIAFDPEWDHFEAAERWVWVLLLSLASFKNRSTIHVSKEALAMRARVSVEVITAAIQKLTEMGCVTPTARPRNADGPRTSRRRHATGQDKTRQDKTEGEPPHDLDLEKPKPSPGGSWISNPRVRDILARRNISEETAEAWFAAYPDAAWLQQEILSAAAWETAKPSNRRKQFSGFLTSWFKRGWGDRPTPLQPSHSGATTAPPDAPSEADIIAESDRRRQAAMGVYHAG